MPLRRLELFNFKSYRGHQVVDFGDASYTAVIGSNGSGKSNLMDAISFVLGVKSAQLRSTQLKDLIYRGRKAAEGAHEMGLNVEVPDTQDDSQSNDARTASVTAVYQDKDGVEWMFKRNITMSGSSTYYLNGKVVTWNVYNAQLEKFNILVKAKNFLVFQGDVEGVASQDSKALAKLIDRISGSLDLAPAYEAAKLAQEKASEAANANHATKRGLLTEAKHFKEQTAEVKQWEKLRASKDAMLHRLLLWKLYHITNEITESTRQVEEASEQLHELQNSVTEADTNLREVRKEHAKAQLNVKKREGNTKKAEKAVDDKKPDLVAIDTQIAHSEKKAKNSEQLYERVQKDQQRQADSLKTLEEGAAQIKARMEEAKEKQRQKSRAQGKALSDNDLAEYRKLRSDANQTAIQERQQLELLRREQKSLRDALASVEDRLQQAERTKSKLATDIEALADREDRMSSRVAEMEKERKGIKAQIDQAQAEKTRIHVRETEINERLHEVMSKLLQAGVDRNQSDREARLKETISNMRRIFPGVHGRVVDLCKPTAHKYELAVMTVLGRNIDAIVVDHEKVAIDCIEYMRQQRAGQATFIPLDTIQTKPVAEKLRNFAKGARLAIDCIEFDANVERAMQHACGNSLICDTAEVAKYVIYEKRQEVKAVTLDGTVFHKSGLITGGKGSGGRKFNDRDVDSLNQQKERLMQQMQELHKSKPKDKEDEGLVQDLARLEAELTTVTDDLDATRLRLTGKRKEHAAIEKDMKKMTPEKEKRVKALDTAEKQAADLADVVERADDKVFGDFCKRIGVANIRDYEDVQLKVAQEEDEALEAFKASNARASHQIDFEKAQLASTEERLELLQSSVEKEKRNVKNLLSTKETIEAEIEDLQAEVERQRGKLEKANAALEEASGDVEGMRDAARRAQRTLDKALKEISSWNDDIERQSSDRHAIYRKCRLEDIDLPLLPSSADLSKVPIEDSNKELAMDVDEDELRPASTDDFGIEPDFSLLEDDDKADSSEAVGQEFEAQITKMKAEIERVVPNMKAIDRLAEVQDGLEEAEEEADNARKASKKARDEFLELKKKRCDLFNKAFTHMSGCIDRIYKDLTKNSVVPTGGMAFLSLEDAEEPYLGGVKYNTMPPGKRFADIEQLSGGEKTMAALALLFSIHSFHPAPFFVLDEVDAALDPTNVSKLARYVREQAEKHVQFLIISLKSTLYEHADGLVGVYREQVENSSRTLTLALSEYE